ncbi:MAG: IS30 family transposase [Actinomycetes bacterium]
MTAEDREDISRFLVLNMNNKEIAARLDRDDSVIFREISRNGGRAAYRAIAAQRRSEEQRLRPKDRKLDADHRLRERVHSDLRCGYSPDQVAGRLKYDLKRGHAVGMGSISHESIYTYLYALPKGEMARMGIHLRTCREQRKPRGNPRSKRSKIIGMRSIDERPTEVAGRQVPGAWEGDLIVGKNGASQAGTLVERKSRFLLIVPLPKTRTSGEVCDAIIDSVSGLPAELVKSITWDQGVEMAQHAALTLKTKIDVYFAHAHSPWERGTNENTYWAQWGAWGCSDGRGSMLGRWVTRRTRAGRLSVDMSTAARRARALAGSDLIEAC